MTKAAAKKAVAPPRRRAETAITLECSIALRDALAAWAHGEDLSMAQLMRRELSRLVKEREGNTMKA